MGKTWQRYVFFRIFYTFLFFLLCILTLYIAIDFSVQGSRWLVKENRLWFDIVKTYLYNFTRFADSFLFFSFLFTTLRILMDLSHNQEIVALQTCGFSMHTIRAPFFVFATLLLVISYTNSQWIAPLSQKHFNTQKKTEQPFVCILSDGSEVVYQNYDENKKELYDVFWIRSFNEIWHMQILKIKETSPEAFSLNLLVRNSDGELEKTKSLNHYLLSEMQCNPLNTFVDFIPCENRSLTALFQQNRSDPDHQSESAAHLHYKLALPTLFFLAICAIIPFAVRFTRNRSSLVFVMCATLIFTTLMMLLDATLILAEHQLISGTVCIWGIIAGSFLLTQTFPFLIQ